MDRKYKLILNKDTFLWVKNNEGLIYNTVNYQAHVFPMIAQLAGICQHLLDINNLYCIELSEYELGDENIHGFVNRIADIGAGKFIPDTDIEKGVVSLMPVLKIVQGATGNYIDKHKEGIGGSIIEHIHELTFYINGSEYGNDQYYQQTIFPRKNVSILESEKIIRFIQNSKSLFLSNINLSGSIFSYPKFEKLLDIIAAFEIQITIYITAGDFLSNINQLKKIKQQENINFHILIDKKSDGNRLAVLLNEVDIPVSATIFIFSEQDCLDVEDISTELNANVVPLYNGENIDFFGSFVFVNQEDVLSIALSKREIFRQQATNTNYFGNLTVLSDGIVYADVNQTPLGTINDTPYSIVYKEFTEGKSWFRVREQMPCRECIYQWLCPSPSNYETVMDKPNLCHIYP
jgi:pseudo-rSAM protein